MKKHLYAVAGMHCASCELLIEKKLSQLPEIDKVEASSSQKQIVISFRGKPPLLEKLNRLLKADGYALSENSEPSNSGQENTLQQLALPLFTAAALFLAFIGLNRFGFAGLVNVTAASSLPAFVLFGLLAGVSTCAALVGGIVLSWSADWQKTAAVGGSLLDKMKPHLFFNLSRLVSYALLGLILGALGSKLGLSLTFNALLVIAVSLLMTANGLKMLGLKAFKNFQIALPKSFSRRFADEADYQGRLMPGIMGALTVFLPCGFTITAESLALVSGSSFQGALIMSAFALGTVPGLLAIGFSAVKMGASSRREVFSRAAGALVLLFAAFNINSQLNVLGLPSLNNFSAADNISENRAGKQAGDLPQLVNGQQVIKMQASAAGYSPAYFKIRAGVPVRWEITDTGTSGCTNAVMSRDLFQGTIGLTPGETSVKEFTVAQPGRYKFSCWMGMVTGIIDVVGQAGEAGPALPAASESSPLTQGCGCSAGASR